MPTKRHGHALAGSDRNKRIRVNGGYDSKERRRASFSGGFSSMYGPNRRSGVLYTRDSG